MSNNDQSGERELLPVTPEMQRAWVDFEPIKRPGVRSPQWCADMRHAFMAGFAVRHSALSTVNVDALRMALKPFATKWAFTGEPDEAEVRCKTESGCHVVTVGAFRRAFTALSMNGPEA